ncbi:MAG: hypothetical protein R3B70_29420 [Polyangiaceae bacterium]
MQLQVCLAEREIAGRLRAYPGLGQSEQQALEPRLLARAKQRPEVVRPKAEGRGASVAPGIVLADIAANTLRRALLGSAAWSGLAVDLEGRLGLPVSAKCALLPLAAALPGVAADGPARDAIRSAATIVSAVASAPSPSLAGEPRWAKEQAEAWIAALRAEAGR